jgi:GTPase SAR1 family protein
METFSVKLLHPSRIIIFGPSGSGKSSLVERILLEQENVFDFLFDNIVYVSGQGFPDFDVINGVKVKKYKELTEDVIDGMDRQQKSLLISDDNIYISNDKIMSNVFTKYSHHKNITVIYLTQNLFPKTKYSRDISINSNYIILMSNPRESTQVKKLSSQVDGTNFIYECFIDATKDNAFSYLLLDFDQRTPVMYRVRSSIFPSDEIFYYVKKEKK